MPYTLCRYIYVFNSNICINSTVARSVYSFVSCLLSLLSNKCCVCVCHSEALDKSVCVCVCSPHTHSKWHLFYFHNFLMAFALLGFFFGSRFSSIIFRRRSKRNSCVYLVEKIAWVFPQTRTNKFVQLQLPNGATATCNLQLQLLLLVCATRGNICLS